MFGLSWNPITRKLAIVLATAAASTALYLAVYQYKKRSTVVRKSSTPTGKAAQTPSGGTSKSRNKRRAAKRRRTPSTLPPPSLALPATPASKPAKSPKAAATVVVAAGAPVSVPIVEAVKADTVVSSVATSTVPSLESTTGSSGLSAAQTVVNPSSSSESSERTVSPSIPLPPPAIVAQDVVKEEPSDLPRTSLCSCRTINKGEPLPDSEALFDPKIKPILGETLVNYDYKSPDPIRLCDPILDRPTQVTPIEKRFPTIGKEQSYLTPFQSINQCLEFANQYANQIEFLIDNYGWLQ